MTAHDLSYEKLIDYAAGDLLGEEYAETTAHVVGCPECSGTLRRFQAARSYWFARDDHIPPPATIRRAYALFTLYGPAKRRIAWPHLNVAIPLFATSAATLLLLGLLGTLFAIQGALPNSTLYPVKTAVEGLQLRFIDELKSLTGAKPTATWTPSSEDDSGTDSPSDAPGQNKVPPGRTKTPPGQLKVPPGRANPTPGHVSPPPGQVNDPPGQINIPPGQVNPPPGQGNNPGGQTDPSGGKNNQPAGQGDSGSGADSPSGQKAPPGQGGKKTLPTPTPTVTPVR